MDQIIDHDAFVALKDRILEAAKPLLTEDEFSAFSDVIQASGYGVVSNTSGGDSIISMEITEDVDMDHPTVRFEGLRISRDRRGQGIGTAIIRATVEFALENGFEFNLSAHPTDIETDDMSDPAWIAAQKRLIAYYARFGMVDDGWGNMHVHINRVDDDHLRARLNHFDIDEAAQHAVERLEQALTDNTEMDAEDVSVAVATALVGHFQDAFTDETLRAQALEMYGDTPDVGPPVGDPGSRKNYLLVDTFQRMAKLPAFGDGLARAFEAAGLSVSDPQALADTVRKTIRIAAMGNDSTPPEKLGKALALRFSSGRNPIMTPKEPAPPAPKV
jgi:GNAT superfamily N-acetyltransferase